MRDRQSLPIELALITMREPLRGHIVDDPSMSTAPACFVAIATGQNIANLAPILSAAKPSDLVTVLETNEARRQAWVPPMVEVLRRHGYGKVVRLATESDDPHEIFDAAQQHRWPEGTLVIIGNGGTKLQSMALYEALRARRPQLLYSLDRPCGLQWFERGPTEAGTIETYGSTPLTLNDVFALRGMYATGDSLAALWRRDRLTDAGRSALQREHGYGFERTPTFQLHDQHHARALARSARGKIERLPRWDRLRKPGKRDRFERTLRQYFPPLDGLSRDQIDKRLESLYNCAIRIAEESHETNDDPGAQVQRSQGTEFEEAVAARFCRWLVSQPSIHGSIQEVWRNVKVEAAERPGIRSIEIDLLVLLKNGLILAIEAKSHETAKKTWMRASSISNEPARCWRKRYSVHRYTPKQWTERGSRPTTNSRAGATKITSVISPSPYLANRITTACRTRTTTRCSTSKARAHSFSRPSSCRRKPGQLPIPPPRADAPPARRRR